MAKQIIYSEALPSGDSARREPVGRRGESDPRPQGPQRGPREEVRRPDHHQGRCDGREGNRAQRSAGEHGRADGARSGLQDHRCGRRRHHDRDHSGAEHLPRRREGGCGRRQPDGPEARHRQGRGSGHGRSEEALQAGFRRHDRAGWHDFRQQRSHHRQHHCRSDEEGRQGRRHHGGRVEDHGDRAGYRGRYAVRPRLSLALLRERCRAHGSGARRSLHPDPREEDQQHEGPAAAARADCALAASRC